MSDEGAAYLMRCSCWGLNEFYLDKCKGCEPPDPCWLKPIIEFMLLDHATYAPILHALPAASPEQIRQATRILVSPDDCSLCGARIEEARVYCEGHAYHLTCFISEQKAGYIRTDPTDKEE